MKKSMKKKKRKIEKENECQLNNKKYVIKKKMSNFDKPI